MPTPKSLRAAPDRIFENYILTLTTDASTGLLKVPQEKFSHVPGPPGDSGNDDNTSDPLDIGFAFKFDGITYYQYMVSTNGWVILVDPTTPGGTPNGTIISDVMVNTYTNSRINSLFTRNHVLFAVWFDDLRNTYSSPQSLGLTSAQIDLYEKGLSQPDKKINPRKYGVQYFLEKNSNEGRRLIIRWNCVSDFSIPNSILNFDFVLYENGKIEYRYASRDSIGASTANEDATIGVFMPGSSNRFRDFSYELDYGVQRQRYKFGGAIYDATYSDTADTFTVPYGVGLKPGDYWPGQKNVGSVFTFQPPLNRRKVLPRQTLRERDSRLTLPTIRTGDSRSGNHNIIFDDRKSIVYKSSGIVVNYPTTLPRFYLGESIGSVENQDLFSGEFVVTGGISRSNVQDYLQDSKKSYISPFTENKLFENDPGSGTDSFFKVGSSIHDVGEGFNQSLKSKTQIRLSFRVDHKTTMFGASSSIYYFNSKTGRWQYPTASFQNSGFDIAEPLGDMSSLRMMEIDRGFNSFGFNISSGSASSAERSFTFPNSTSNLFNRYINRQNEIDSLTGKYEKSIQVNQEYNANDNETIAIPINHPFLLEKAVIEIPIEAGPGWFHDRTQCNLGATVYPGYPFPEFPGPYNNSGNQFDMGGPGLTFALYNQINTGPRTRRRDLILSGTITHDLDNSAKIAYYQVGYGYGGYGYLPGAPMQDVYQCVPRGFLAYGTPTAVITGSNNQFTGSVRLKCQAAISNGILLKDSFFVDHDPTLYSYIRTEALESIFNTAKLKIDKRGTVQAFKSLANPPIIGSGSKETILINCNNFSRSGAGFEPSGRSIFGKEYASAATGDISKDIYDNPFFLYKNSIVKLTHKSTGPVIETSKTSTDAITDMATEHVAILTNVIQKQQSSVSPYLLFPNDKLILSISKSRPFFLSMMAPSPYTMNKIQHDIKLTTGSINITLYGSLVSNGREFHDTLNQPLASDAIHEVVIGE